VDSKIDSKEEKIDKVHLKNEIFDFIKIKDFENVEQKDRESIKILIDGSNSVKFLLDFELDTQIMSLEKYQKMFPDIKVENLITSIIKVASDKLVKTHVTRLTYAHKGIMLTNMKMHIVNSEINIVGHTLMKKLRYSIKYTPLKTEPMINENFYTKKELDEIKELLPEILKIVEKLEKYKVLLDLRPLNDLLDEFQYEIPNLNNIIKKLSRFKFYCLIDIAKAYCQLAYTSESGKELFYFSIRARRFYFVKVPYGVKSTSSYYALALQDIFKNILITFNMNNKQRRFILMT
jgi:hypothetical protein